MSDGAARGIIVELFVHMQLEEKESLVLELEEKLSMLDRPALENNLQQARSDLQTCREKLQALQAEAAAQKEQHQQQRKQFQMLQETKLQAQVRAQILL